MSITDSGSCAVAKVPNATERAGGYHTPATDTSFIKQPQEPGLLAPSGRQLTGARVDLDANRVGRSDRMCRFDW